MKKFVIGVIIVFLYSCSQNKTNDKQIIEKCLCDSIGIFTENGKKEIECYAQKSLINIKSNNYNDTVEITRYYTNDSVWHVQEYLITSNNKIVYPTYAMYCDIKDTAEFYKLSYVSDEYRNTNQNIVVNKILGIEVELNGGNIKSNNESILVLKNKFKGLVKLDKRTDIIYNGEKDISRKTIYIEAETMIKYGNLLNQYNAISKYCSK
jgi:hypothetical protein